MTEPPVPPTPPFLSHRYRRAAQQWYRRTLPAYWIFLFCVTHFPKLTLDLGIREADKIAHFAAFGLLAFLLWRFAGTICRPVSFHFLWIAALLIGLYAALDEWTQPYFNRSCDLFDWLNDMAGTLIVLALLGLLEWRRRRRTRRPTSRADEDMVDSLAPKR